MNSQPYTLRIIPERMSVRDDEVSELDIVIEVQSSATQIALGRKSLNLCLVIDQSGSMSGEKIKTAKRSAIDILGRVQDGDLFSVVTFNNEARVIVNPLIARADAQGKIEVIRATGTTNLALGWHVGLLELQTHQTDVHANRLILLSDGQANSGETKKSVLGKESARARELGITTSTIGIGSDFQEDILDAIATESGGRFWYIGDSRIEEILNVEFQGALSIIVERPRLAIALPQGVRITQELNEVRKVADRYRIRPISGNYVFNLAIRLEFDPAKLVGRDIPLKAMLYDGDEVCLETSISLTLRSPSEYVTAPVSPVVLSVVQQYQSARSSEIMREKLDEGDFSFVKDMLIQEIEGVKVVKDKLAEAEDAMQQPAAGMRQDEAEELLRREHLLMDRKMRSYHLRKALMDMMEITERAATSNNELSQALGDLRIMCRKLIVTEKHHDSSRWYPDDDFRETILRAMGIIDRLIATEPDNTELADIRRRLHELLAVFNP